MGSVKEDMKKKQADKEAQQRKQGQYIYYLYPEQDNGAWSWPSSVIYKDLILPIFPIRQD